MVCQPRFVLTYANGCVILSREDEDRRAAATHPATRPRPLLPDPVPAGRQVPEGPRRPAHVLRERADRCVGPGCREVNEATAEYREAQDLLGGFFEECLQTVERELVPSEEVFKAYLSWAEEAGERPLTRRALSHRIGKRGYRSTNRRGEGSRHHRCWAGLRLTEAGRQRAGVRLLPSQAGLTL